MGAVGSGKSYYARQLVVNAALNGQKSLIVTFEDKAEKLQNDIITINPKAKDLFDAESIIIKEVNSFDIANSSKYFDEVDNNGVNIIVIDSLTTLELSFDNKDVEYRKFIEDLYKRMQEKNVVTIFVKDLSDNYNKDNELFEKINSDIVIEFNYKKKKYSNTLIKTIPEQNKIDKPKKKFNLMFWKKK